MSAFSTPARFAVDAIALAVVSLLLLVGGTQSGIVTPTFTWVTGALVLAGLGTGFVFWTYSTGNGPGLTRLRLSGYPLVLWLFGVLTVGILWIAVVPPVYGSDLIYGLVALFWTTYALSCADRF